MYALADCNNFFVSCERVFRPDLRLQPVLVLSNNDGCVISRSNEVKALGIKMGVPLYQIKDVVHKHNIQVFSSNYALYGDMSSRVLSTLRKFSSAVEVYSIDEAFLDLRGMENCDFKQYAKEISLSCEKHTGVPVSVGIAPSKTLAKIAASLCKHYPALNGGCYLHRPEDIEKVLKKTEISDVWGIGRRHTASLKAIGVNTAYEFTQLPAHFVKSKMSITGLRTYKELKGESCIDFVATAPAKQQICVSRSFAKEITSKEELSEQISLFTVMACNKLRKQKCSCNYISVFILTNIHKENAPQQYQNRLVKFSVATDSTLEINSAVQQALDTIFKNGYHYKKGGVIISGIVPTNSVQLNLFDNIDRDKHARLMQSIDKVNSLLGPNSITLASQSPEIKMNRNHLSPSYTTNWDEIITIKE